MGDPDLFWFTHCIPWGPPGALAGSGVQVHLHRMAVGAMELGENVQERLASVLTGGKFMKRTQGVTNDVLPVECQDSLTPGSQIAHLHPPERNSVDVDLFARFALELLAADHHEHSAVNGHFEAEIRDFIDQVTAGNPPNVTFEDGRRALLLSEAALKSYQTNKPVEVNYG